MPLPVTRPAVNHRPHSVTVYPRFQLSRHFTTTPINASRVLATTRCADFSRDSPDIQIDCCLNITVLHFVAGCNNYPSIANFWRNRCVVKTIDSPRQHTHLRAHHKLYPVDALTEHTLKLMPPLSGTVRQVTVYKSIRTTAMKFRNNEAKANRNRIPRLLASSPHCIRVFLLLSLRLCPTVNR